MNCTTSCRRTKIPSTRWTKFGEIAIACTSVVFATCSRANFSVEHVEDGTRAIRFGLAQIKHVVSGAVEALLGQIAHGLAA